MSYFSRKIRAAFPWLQDAKAVKELLLQSDSRVFTCACCGNSQKFRLAGYPPRLNAMCPTCGSLERHRQFTLLLNDRPHLTKGKAILHFAPEPTLRKGIEAVAASYIGADLDPNRGDREMNIEAIDLPADSIELVICNHVMEHVDDAKALAELHRILVTGGVALLTVPLVEGWPTTYENPEITEPAERLLHFGQSDHVRYYGRDFRDRVIAAGFDLEEFVAEEPYVGQYGLLPGETIFIATKR